jgi:glycosyltransferase involved in cell wall biosynthesis
MPRVSVIVAARDAARTLPSTLDSIAAQTFRDWELIVVDDGSGDGTASIAQAFAGGPLRLLRNESSLGPAAARNAAVREASGELIASLDSDDRWLPGYLARQVALYDESTAAGVRVALVTCDARLVTPDGEVSSETWSDRVGPVQPATLARLLAENRVCSPVLVPRAVFVALGGFEESIWRGEDYDLWLRMLEEGYAIVSTEEPLALYRFSPGGLTAAAAEMAASTRGVYERALARGRLGDHERRIARKRARLFAALEARARIAAATGGRKATRRLRSFPLIARVALENPERWLRWAMRGPRAAGSGRHT